MDVSIHDELDKAYAAQIQDSFNVFVENVTGAKDKDAALASAGQEFLQGVNLIKKVLAKAKELTVA